MPGSLDGSWKEQASARDARVAAFLQLDPSIGAADSAPSCSATPVPFATRRKLPRDAATRGFSCRSPLAL